MHHRQMISGPKTGWNGISLEQILQRDKEKRVSQIARTVYHVSAPSCHRFGRKKTWRLNLQQKSQTSSEYEQ